MRLPKKQKIILVVTFGFGIFVAIVDIVRIYYLQNAQRNVLRAKEAGMGGADSYVKPLYQTLRIEAHRSLEETYATIATSHGMLHSLPCGAPSRSIPASCVRAYPH